MSLDFRAHLIVAGLGRGQEDDVCGPRRQCLGIAALATSGPPKDERNESAALVHSRALFPDPIYQIFENTKARESKLRQTCLTPSGSPIEAVTIQELGSDRSPDFTLPALLLRWCAHSCGAVADLHRASRTSDS